jgi:putative transposase
MNALEIEGIETLRTVHRERIDEALREGALERNSLWSESIAVGSEAFALTTKTAFGVKGRNLNVVNDDGVCVLKEAEASYGAEFGVKNRPIVLNNSHCWDVSYMITVG